MDLSHLHPELLLSWDSKKNSNFDIHNIKANEKVWRKCEKGHEYQSTIDLRSHGRGCPYCAGRIAIEGENDLATTNPELLKEWDNEKNGNLTPNKVKAGSGVKVRWICDKGHKYQASPSSRSVGKGCPYCSNQKVLKGYNDLGTTHPELAKQWNYEKNGDITPDTIIAGSNKKYWWKCERGHEWEAVVGSRAIGNKCPYCSNQKVLKGYNDLGTTHPELAKRWNYEKNGDITPDMVNAGSNKKYWWKCEKGHEWEAVLASRAKCGSGCPYCSNQKLLKGYNDLATTHPELAKQWNYEKNGNITPDMVNAGSNKKYWWKCEKGHEWEAVVGSRANGCGCSICSGNSKKTDEEFKEEIRKANPNIIILNKYETAKTKLKCKCKTCGNEREVVANHLQQGQGCPNCANIKRGEDQRIGQENFVIRMKEVNPNILVLGTYQTAHSRVKVKCLKCNHEWNPAAWDILQGNGCPKCSHTGTSYMEQFILQSFLLIIGENAIKSRDTKTIGKELDIYIPELKFAIEPGSWFWHKDKIEEDLKKRDMCKSKGINLVIIYDGCKNEKYYSFLEKNNIIFFKKDLGSLKERDTLRGLVIDLFELVGINKVFNEEERTLISDKAYMASRRDSTEEFIDKAKFVNDKIDVIGEFLGYGSKTKVKCKKCGYEWNMSPIHIMNGHGCPKCLGRNKTTQEFIEQLAKKNPNVKVLGEYVNSNTKVKIQCKICGNIRESAPGNLLYGFGCPICARKRIGKKNSKKVLQYSLDGKFIGEYESVSDASRKTGINSRTICNVCNGKGKIAGGYVWKYV